MCGHLVATGGLVENLGADRDIDVAPGVGVTMHSRNIGPTDIVTSDAVDRIVGVSLKLPLGDEARRAEPSREFLGIQPPVAIFKPVLQEVSVGIPVGRIGVRSDLIGVGQLVVIEVVSLWVAAHHCSVAAARPRVETSRRRPWRTRHNGLGRIP